MTTVVPPSPETIDKPLPKIVVIMGAGSSAEFGVPTLRSIFKNPEAAA
jgi:NAD-dependent SIR2 family protein deacetylase